MIVCNDYVSDAFNKIVTSFKSSLGINEALGKKIFYTFSVDLFSNLGAGLKLDCFIDS